METSSPGREAVEQLAEEFVERFRRGERPSLSEYAARYPEHAEEIHKLFPALVVMEQIAPESEAAGLFSAADSLRGRRLEHPERLGDYRVLREIGRGGMGVVYEAEQVSLGRHVALKVLPRQVLPDGKQRQRFERESRSAARLHHTNIVPVFGVGEEGGLHYYVMQYIQGQGLDAVLVELRRLQEQGGLPGPMKPAGPDPISHPEVSVEAVARSLLTRFDPAAVGGEPTPEPADGAEPAPIGIDGLAEDDSTARAAPSPSSIAALGQTGDSRRSGIQAYWRSVAHIAAQVAEALAYAHQAGVLHRDIKPANLLLDTRGNVWVTDFGLAKSEDQHNLTNPGDVVGTLRYMAPERFEGHSDARCDLYALGATLYELLTLRPPFEGKSRERLIERVLHQEPIPPRRRDARIPRDLEVICLKCLSKEPGHRYGTAAELAEELRRFLAGEPIRARRVSAMEWGWRWCKRNPVVAWLLAAVFVLLAAVAGVASVGYLREAALRAEADRQRQEADRQRAAADAAQAQAKGEASRARTAEQETRRQWYAASSNLMQPAWDTGQMGRLRGLLTETEAYPDRGFEWYYWQRLCHLDQHTLIGHRSEVLSVSWSPDGARLATGSYDGTAKVWDVAGGRPRLTLRGHAGLIYSVSWSPDGARLATGSQDNTAKVWDAAGGQVLFTLEGHTNSITAVYWSPDGARLATGSGDGLAKVWDAAGGQPRLTLKGHTGAVRSLSWSPDGARLATGSYDGTAKVWDAAGGRELLTLRGHAGRVYTVTWSPDGTQLATGSEDGTAKVWDAAGGHVQLTLRGHAGLVYEVSWSRDGARLATGSSDGLAKTWDAADGRERLTFRGHTSQVRSVSWSPDGARLATGSSDGTAKVWDAAGDRERLTLVGHAGPVGSVSWSPDGARLATGSGDGLAKVWDAAGGREMRTLKGHTGLVGSVSWSPDGARLATGSGDGLAKVWDAAGGREMRTLKGHTSQVRSVSWSPDGMRLATGSLDGTVKVWDAAAGHELLTLKEHTGTVSSVSWSPDGARLATASYDGTAKVWDAAGGRVLLTLEGHTGLVYSVSWSRDGTRLATGSTDGTAKTWDAGSGRVLLTLKGHINQVRSVSWSPDGARLATGSLDGTAKVWDAAGGRELLTLKGHAGEVIVSWSPDGARLATGSYDGTAKVWDAAGAAAVQQWGRQDRDVQDLLDSNDFRGPHAQGFLQTWLLLLPLPFAAGETSEQALNRPQLPGEASLRPRPGERVTVGGQPWLWQEYRSPRGVVDFNAVLGRVAERSVAYAVCYIESDRARDGLWLQLGSDDQAKVTLNGREIYRGHQPRTFWTLDTVGPVGLKPGINVLQFKVVNETGQWEGCARLVDDANRPVQGLRVKLTP